MYNKLERRSYYLKNRNKLIEYGKEYYKKNKNKILTSAKIQRALYYDLQKQKWKEATKSYRKRETVCDRLKRLDKMKQNWRKYYYKYDWSVSNEGVKFDNGKFIIFFN